METEIIKDSVIDNLSISWDYEEDENNIAEREVVLLFTPDMDDKMNHHHIRLTDSQAETLHEWLHNFLAEKVNAGVI